MKFNLSSRAVVKAKRDQMHKTFTPTNISSEDPAVFEVEEAEICPGWDKYLKVKALLEEKYGPITASQFRDICGAVLKTMTHEKRVKKQFGDDNHGYWRIRAAQETAVRKDKEGKK